MPQDEARNLRRERASGSTEPYRVRVFKPSRSLDREADYQRGSSRRSLQQSENRQEMKEARERSRSRFESHRTSTSHDVDVQMKDSERIEDDLERLAEDFENVRCRWDTRYLVESGRIHNFGQSVLKTFFGQNIRDLEDKNKSLEIAAQDLQEQCLNLKADLEKEQNDKDAWKAKYNSAHQSELEECRKRSDHNLEYARRADASEKATKQSLVRAQSDIQGLRQQLQQATEQVREFRQIVQRNPDEGEPLDVHVQFEFRSIADEVQKLVRRCPSGTEPRLNDTQDWVRRKYTDALSEGINTRLMLRCEIFDTLMDTHFGKGIFGAPSCIEEADREMHLEQELSGPDANQILAKLEKMALRSLDETEVAEWRRNTIGFLSKLPEGIRRDAGCANRIARLLLPCFNNEEDRVAKTQERINTLCDKMYAFALCLRGSRSKFEIIYPQKGEKLDGHGGSIEVVEDMLKGRNEGTDSDDYSGSRVVCTLFGGLKKVHHRSRDIVMLVPAQVVAQP